MWAESDFRSWKYPGTDSHSMLAIAPLKCVRDCFLSFTDTFSYIFYVWGKVGEGMAGVAGDVIVQYNKQQVIHIFADVYDNGIFSRMQFIMLVTIWWYINRHVYESQSYSSSF